MAKKREPIFDLDYIKAKLDQQPWEKDWNDPSSYVKSVFLGTVFGLTPSGKYYTPWACSNVEGDCKYCHGTGNIKKRDACNICNGTGKRSIWELSQMRNESVADTTAFLLNDDRFSDGVDRERDTFKCWSCYGEGSIARTCPRCGGYGSRSAWLDELWREQAEAELESIGASLENGEGDPCDLFACMYADEDEVKSENENEDESKTDS